MKAAVVFCGNVCQSLIRDDHHNNDADGTTTLSSGAYVALDALAQKGTSGYLTTAKGDVDDNLAMQQLVGLASFSNESDEKKRTIEVKENQERSDAALRRARARQFFPPIFGRARMAVLSTDSETLAAQRTSVPHLTSIVSIDAESSAETLVEQMEVQWGDACDVVILDLSGQEAAAEVRLALADAVLGVLLAKQGDPCYLSVVAHASKGLNDYVQARDESLGYTTDHRALFLRPSSSSTRHGHACCIFTSYCPDLTRLDKCNAFCESACVTHGGSVGMPLSAFLPDVIGKMQLRDKYGN